jgi:hypothetical protein
MEMSLPQYIASRRELDNLAFQRVYAILLVRGKIEQGTPLQHVRDACTQAVPMRPRSAQID